MKFLIKLSILNLARHKRRTIITAFAIAIGILFFIFLDSMLKGADSESVRNLKWYETSSARIYTRGYWDNRVQKSLEYNIENPGEIIALLEKNGFPATGRAEFSGDMILGRIDFGEDGNVPVSVTAIDPERDERVFHFRDTLIDGRFLRPDDQGLILGSWLAEDLGAKVGATVTIVTRGRGGFYEAMDLEILGIVNCPNPTVNRKLIMMPLAIADEYLFLEGTVSEIDIKLPDNGDPEAGKGKIGALLASREDVEVFSFRDLASEYLTMIDMARSTTGIMLFLVFIIAAVGISNTMLLTIYERFREMGMMRALGMTDLNIKTMLLIEAAGIGFIGALIGVALGIFSVLFLIHVGIDYGFATRQYDIVYRVQAVFRGEWNWGSMAGATLVSIIISPLIALFPVSRGLRLDIPSSLSHQ